MGTRTLEDLKAKYLENESSGSAQYGETPLLPKFDLVFICAAADTETLSKALETHRFLREVSPDTPIIVPTYENEGFRRFLPGPDDDCSYYRAISVVSILEKSFTPELIDKGTIEEMSRLIHVSYLQIVTSTMSGPKPYQKKWS